MVEINPEQFEKIARTVHEALSAWRVANGQHGHKTWDKLGKKERQSTYDSVRFVLDNPSSGPRGQHEQWMAQKHAEGWTYGPERDSRSKTHPMLTPFDELPDYERRKDGLLNAIVLALAIDAGAGE